jgi:nickel-dependent lactate racemase
MAVLRYGIDSSIDLEFSNGTMHAQCGTPRGVPLEDLTAAVAAALHVPLDYPPLGKSTTPGDRVVLAIGRGIPQVARITAAVVHTLIAAGVHPDGISVLRTEADVEAGAESPCRLLNGELGERIRLSTHDPDNRGRMAYLAASENGEPIMLNRLITDADLVLPIGCLHRASTAGYFGIHTPVFPAFSDYKTQLRFRRHDLLPGNAHRHRDLVHEVDQVGWLLGINFSIQIVPAAGEGVLHVVAGQSDAVRRRGRDLYREAWACPVPHQASLVVAAIEGGRVYQTWENLGRAVAAAMHLVEEDGAIAVCCDLATKPGPALQTMACAPSRDSALRQIRRDCPVDALPAVQIARALDHDHVYLLSRLDPSLVEELDMTPLGGADELARLARQYQSCTLLSNAQYAVVKVEEGEGERDEG